MRPGYISGRLRLPRTTGAQGKRPARNRSQTVALVNQLLDGNAFQTYVVFLNKGQHLTHSFPLCTVGSTGARRLFLFTQNLQGLADHFLDGVEVAGFQLILDQLFLLGASD